MRSRALGAATAAALIAKTFGPADSHRRQIAQLGRQLPENGALRLERLRGFGAPLGTLATCGCARIDLPDGKRAVLITSTDAGGRSFAWPERLKRLVESSEHALLAFTQDGQFAGISAAGRRLFGMSEFCFAEARRTALAEGVATVTFGAERVALYRIGSGNQVGLVAVPLPILPEEIDAPSPAPTPDAEPAADAAAASSTRVEAIHADAAETPLPPPMDAMTERHTDYEAPALSNEAPAEFLLIDEPAEAGLFEPLAPVLQTTTDTPSDAASLQTPMPHDQDDVGGIEAGDTDAGRRHPLRFSWQMDAEGRFTLGSDAFTRLIGDHSAAQLGRRWHDLAVALELRRARCRGSRDPADLERPHRHLACSRRRAARDRAVGPARLS